MVGRTKPKTEPKVTLTVHQVVAYNFRRAREEARWTQKETSDQLERFLGYKLNQAGVSAIEKTFDSERRRNIDVAEVVAFARCFKRPVGWFFLPPPGVGRGILEPVPKDTGWMELSDLLSHVVGLPEGAKSFEERVNELLSSDEEATWSALRYAFGGFNDIAWEKQIDLRRRAVQAMTLARFATPADDIVKGMAALLVQLVKTTPMGFAQLRNVDPDEALRVLAEGDQLVQPLIVAAESRRRDGVPSETGFDGIVPIDIQVALGRQEDRTE